MRKILHLSGRSSKEKAMWFSQRKRQIGTSSLRRISFAIVDGAHPDLGSALQIGICSAIFTGKQQRRDGALKSVSQSVLHLFLDQRVTSEETHVVATSSQALARFRGLRRHLSP